MKSERTVSVTMVNGLVYQLNRDVGVDLAVTFADRIDDIERVGITTMSGEPVLLNVRHIVSIRGVTREQMETYAGHEYEGA